MKRDEAAMDKIHRWVPAVMLAVGLIIGGGLLGRGFTEGRRADRFVTVKGLAERDVQADLALWPLRFVSTDNDLRTAQARIEQSKATILEFLDEHGIGADQVELLGLEVTDVLANPYRSGPADSRFIIAQTLMVRSEDPVQVAGVSQRIGDLVEAGVVLSSDRGPSAGPTYLFTGLNELKPEMIASATANAREAARQFARDSGSRLGSIRRANQGVFVILARDRTPGMMEESQLYKTVRVVTTVEYLLVD
jgi:uncharacterized protein